MTFFSLVILVGMTLFLIDREKDLIYRGKIGAGEIILSHLARSAVIPLLEDDTRDHAEDRTVGKLSPTPS